MPSVTVIWNREKRQLTPILFNTTSDADLHIARLKAQEIRSGGPRAVPTTYDKVTVTIP